MAETKVYQDPEDFKKEWKYAQQADDTLGMVKEPSILISRETQRVSGNKLYNYPWSQYRLDQLPGCCGVVVSNGANIHPDYRDTGLGQYFHKERIQFSEYMGYSCMMCTTISRNEAENHILKKNDWKKVHEFENRRTGNTVYIWIKDL